LRLAGRPLLAGRDSSGEGFRVADATVW